MDEIFLEAAVSSDKILVSLESAVCLVTISYLDCKEVIVNLVISDQTVINNFVELNTSDLNFNVVSLAQIPSPSKFCSLPSYQYSERPSCVAGLCAVLRQLVKRSNSANHHLLGFRECCLVACAEVSMWTKFCEVDIINSAKELIQNGLLNDLLPVSLARLEAHLSLPVRIHNRGKQKSLEHSFVEGPNFVLADLLIAVPVFVMLRVLNCYDEAVIPLTLQWFDRVLKDQGLASFLSIFSVPHSISHQICEPKWKLPPIERHSLYKSDPTRYKPRNKIFTQQTDIDQSMEILESIEMQSLLEPVGHDVVIDLSSGPLPDVPSERLLRKTNQLLNLAKAAVKVSRPGDTIVDFCCGSGHLGLIIAYLLPRCTVILLDNKLRSLIRAVDKINTFKLKNIFIVQTNLDYFVGDFQVGVSLHACGVASDLVINKCINKGAHFVLCPCCYGGIQSNHMVTYPQSKEFREAGLSERGLVVLGHCADQAGTTQGEKGMLMVDTDRCLLAQNNGYSASLAKLVPPNCTPRNNLIVAVKQ